MFTNSIFAYYAMLNYLTIDHPVDGPWFSTRMQCERLGVKFKFNEHNLHLCLTGLEKRVYNGILGMDPATYTQMYLDLELDSVFSNYGYTADCALYSHDGSKRFLLLFSPTEYAKISPKEMVHCITEYIQSYYEERLFLGNPDYPNTSAYAPVEGGISEIHKIFQSVNEMHRLSFFIESPTVFDTDWVIAHQKPLDFQTLINLLREFETSLLSGKPTHAQKLLHSLFDDSIKKSLSLSLCEDALLYLKSTFELYLTAYQIDLKEPLDTVFSVSSYPNLARCTEKLESVLQMLLDRICTCSVSSDSIVKALYYIRLHYTNPDLSLSDISAYAGINQNYLSSLFKQQTGLSIRQYITNERLHLSQHIMSHAELSLQEVALSCGFLDVKYFAQVFRSNTGLTPQAWKKQNI